MLVYVQSNNNVGCKNMKQSKMLVGYCRVSTDNQKEEGTIEIQEKSLKEYVEKNGYELVKIFKDNGISGGSEL